MISVLQTGSKRRFFVCIEKIQTIMDYLKKSSKTPVLRAEHLGQLFKDFYAYWDYNAPKLKYLSCLMYDAYISETKDLVEVNDASFFNRGFIDLLRAYSKEKTLPELGRLFKKNLLEPLQSGNPHIVENMFYTCIGNQDDITIRKNIIRFYRSFEELMERVGRCERE